MEEENSELHSHHHHHHHHHSSGGSSGHSHHSHHHHGLERFQRLLSIFCHNLSYIPISLAFLILGIMPCVYYGGEQWWLPLVFTILVSAYALWMLSGWWCGGEHIKVKFGSWSCILLIPIGIGIVQLLHFQPLVKLFAPRSFELWEKFNELGVIESAASITMAPIATINRMFLIGVCLLFYIIIRSKAHHRKLLKLTMLSIVIAAAGNAFYAFFTFLFSNKMGMRQMQAFSGAFSNRNHFGFLMMLGCLACAGLMAAISSEKHRHKEEGDWDGWRLLIIPLGLVLFILASALLLSLSRGAFIALLVSISIFGAIWICKGHEFERATRQKLLVLLTLIAIALVFAMPYAMETLSSRYESLMDKDFTMDARWKLWKLTLGALKEHWILGSGLGSFGDVIQRFEFGGTPNALIQHAHNDFLEMFVEIGLPFSILIIAIVITAWYIMFHRCWNQSDRTYKWLGLAALVSLIGAFLHEMVDYNLQAAPNAIAMTAMIAIATICGRKTSEHKNDKKTPEEIIKQNRIDRYRIRILLIPAALIVLCVVLPFAINVTSSSWSHSLLSKDIERTERAWQTGKGDFLRRCEFSAKALKYGIGKTSILRLRAVAYVQYLNGAWKSTTVEQRSELWAEAADIIAKSFAMSPLKGDTAIACAYIFHTANDMGARQDTNEYQLKIYDWACFCQPGILRTIEQDAYIYYEFFLRSYYRNNDDADALRERAIKQITRLLELKPRASMSIFAAIDNMVNNDEQLLAMSPNNVDAQLTLMDYLISRAKMDVAIKLSDDMKANLANAEEHDKHYYTNLINVLNRRGMIFEVTNQPEKRLEVFDELMNILHDNNEVKPFDEHVFESEKRMMQTTQLLAGRRSRYPVNEYNVLHEAEMFAFKGNVADAIHILTSITYFPDQKLPKEMLLSARNLLRSGLDGITEETILRSKFISAVVDLLLAEQGENVSIDMIIFNLQSIQKKNENDYRWINEHLFPYYEGRAYEHMGKKEEALKAYLRSLSLCPRHYWAIERVAKLDINALDNDARKLWDIVSKRNCPIAVLQNGLTWMANHVFSDTVTKMHEKQEAWFIFLCNGASSHFSYLDLYFYDNNGYIFTHDILLEDGESLTWRVGELIVKKFSWQPFVATLSSVRRTLVPGNVRVTLKKTGYPLPETNLFKVVRE